MGRHKLQLVSMALLDPACTFQARALYCLLLTRPGDRMPTREVLAAESKCSVQSISKYLMELEDKGWLARKKIYFGKNETGPFRMRYDLLYTGRPVA